MAVGQNAATLEKMGIPVVTEDFNLPDLLAVANENSQREGVPMVRQVAVPADTFILDYSPWVPDFIEELTRPLTAEEAESGTYQPPIPPRIAMTGTYEEIMAYFEGDLIVKSELSGGPWAWMTDGLPIAPPTEEAVARMLQGTSHSPDEEFEFRQYGTRIGTIEKIAVNAVMAGAKPEYMPAILAIAESGACVGYSGDSSFGNLYVVSGPYAKEIGMNYGFDFWCTGNPANCALERSCQLMGVNLGGCLHGLRMLERTGNKHWGSTFAENPLTPWETLNVHNGYEPTESILMFFRGKVEVIPFQNYEVVNANDLEGCQAGSPVHAVGAFMSNTNVHDAMIILTPDTARLWQRKYPDICGTMSLLEQYIMDNVLKSYDILYTNCWWLKRGTPPEDWVPGSGEMFNAITDPANVTIIVAGGTGDAWSFGFGSPMGRGGTSNIYSIDKWR